MASAAIETLEILHPLARRQTGAGWGHSSITRDQEYAATLLGDSEILSIKHSPKSHIGDDTLLISEVCLATGARWGEAEGLQPRQVRNQRIQYTKTKSSKNRTIPITGELYKRLQKALPFKPSYDAFRRAVDAINLDLPAGQLTHVLRHTFASHYMMKGGDILTLQKVLGHATLAMTQKYAHFSPGHMAEVVNLNPMANRVGHFLDTSSVLDDEAAPES